MRANRGRAKPSPNLAARSSPTASPSTRRRIWVTSLICNGLIRIHPDGGQQIMLMEDQPDHSAPLAAAFAQGALPANALGPIPGTRLQHVTSIAFGGSDQRTAVIGTLHNDTVFRFTL
jgi:hypothetical protein